MTSRCAVSGAAGAKTVGRRAVLAAAGGSVLALVGCGGVAPFPAPSSTTTRSGPPRPPSPMALPGVVEARQQEEELARYAAAALHRFAGDLRPADRHLLARIREAHLAHAAALAAPDPLQPTTPAPDRTNPTVTGSPTPPPTVPDTPAAAIATLGQLENRLTNAHAARTLQPRGADRQSRGLVLLWASSAAAAAGCAAACARRRDPGATLIQQDRRPVELPDPATATSDVVAQCHALVFGLQAALPRLSGTAAAAAYEELARYRAVRDRLSLRLAGAGHPVPAARVAYRLPVQPTTTATAIELINGMDQRMLPYLGRCTAVTVTVAGRRTALQTLIDTGRGNQDWSPAIAVWPGWPD